jgi:hypothetical protein
MDDKKEEKGFLARKGGGANVDRAHEWRGTK